MALPSGASNCVGGRAAVGVSHLEGRVTKGSLEEGGLSLSIGDTTLQVGTIAKFPKGETLEWTLVADDRPFRGFLIRAEDRSDDVSKKRGTTQALDSDDDLAKIAETVCVNAFNVGGITHTNNNQKRRISGTFRMDEAVEELQIDVTAVIKNRGSVSIYYYTGYVVSIVDDTTVEEVETTTIPLGNGVVPLVLRASSCSDEDPCGLCEGG